MVAVWNATDHDGQVVPNGFYHLVFTQAMTDGSFTVLNRGVYVNPYSQRALVQLTAYPNLLYSAGTVQVTASVEGSPADGKGLVKIHAMNGELVKALDLSNGQGAWDLTNRKGETVASGLYFISLDVMDPTTGAEAHKTVKVVVLR